MVVALDKALMLAAFHFIDGQQPDASGGHTARKAAPYCHVWLVGRIHDEMDHICGNGWKLTFSVARGCCSFVA